MGSSQSVPIREAVRGWGVYSQSVPIHTPDSKQGHKDKLFAKVSSQSGPIVEALRGVGSSNWRGCEGVGSIFPVSSN